MGSLTADTEWFKPWRTIKGESESPPTVLELEVLIRGVFQKDRFLKLLRHYIVFEHDTDSDLLIKIIAGYHQFHAANAAIEATVKAASPTGVGNFADVGKSTLKSLSSRADQPFSTSITADL